MKSENCKKLLDVWKYIFSKVDFFEEYNVDCYLHFEHMTVTPEYRNRRIVSEFYNYALEWFSEWHFNPVKSTLQCSLHTRTSKESTATVGRVSYDLKIHPENRFERLKIYSNRDFVLNGKSFADRIGDQDSVAVLGFVKPYKN